MKKLLLALLALPCNAFYLPGVVPKQFEANEVLPVKVNSLTSVKTHLPYDYYKLPFCSVSGVLHGSLGREGRGWGRGGGVLCLRKACFH